VSKRWVRSIEWPTLLLGLIIYAAWLALTWHAGSLPPALLFLLGGWVVAWHGSLQHEAVHGHPFGSSTLTAAFAGVPLGLLLPFSLYRRSHLAHHGVRELTDPRTDPESFYVDAAAWTRATSLGRAWLVAESTLLGRMALGPFRALARLALGELARARREPSAVIRVWLVHVLTTIPLLYWIVVVCDMSLGAYLLCFVYPGLSLTLLRSFIEHRAEGEGGERSVIVEAEAPLGWLFLHNNLHALHHAEPALPWYALPARYRERERELLSSNGGYLFHGYREVAWRFLLRPKDAPLHPGSLPVSHPEGAE